MTTHNDNNGNNKNSENLLGFSLSPNSSHPSSSPSSNPTNFYNFSSQFNYQNLYYGGGEGGIYSAFPIMPLKSDGSLCLMDVITKSHSQGMVSSTPPPKLENFFGGVTMGAQDLDSSSTLYYHQNLDHNHQQQQQDFQIQPLNYLDNYNGLYQSIQQDQETKDTHIGDHGGVYLPNVGDDDDITTNFKNWVSRSYPLGGGNCGGGGGGGVLQSLSLSMSPSSSCVTGSQQQITNVGLDSKKRGCERVEKQQEKQIVHRKSLDTFGQRTSQYRGVTRHRWTGRYEAHLWDNSCKKEGQTRKGRQVYLGGYDMEEKAARAYDLAALKYWGASTHINFPLENYGQELEEMKNMSRQEYVAHLRRRSSGFSRGASVYRGVTRHHHHGRWQARIGRVAGNKDLYLGTFSTQEDAAEAYDVAAIKFRGVNAVTNFDISRYNVEKIMASNTLLAGELARRTKDPDPNPRTDHVLPNQAHNGQETKTISNETSTNGSMFDWKMEPYNQTTSGPCTPPDEGESSTTGTHLASSGIGGGYQENSPEKSHFPMVLGLPPPLSLAASKSVNTWIPTATARSQVRSHIPIFAAWTDA